MRNRFSKERPGWNNDFTLGRCISWLPNDRLIHHLQRCLLLVLLGLSPAPARAELNFQFVPIDESFFAYERDVGDIDGDGDNDVVGIQEGQTTLQVFRAPSWDRSTLITFSGTFRFPRADDFKLADIDGDGDVDVVTRLGNAPSSDSAGIAVWCENLGGGSGFTQHLIGNSLEYVKDIVVADFDRDNRPDVAMRMDHQTQLWLQEPDSTWTEVRLDHPAHEGLEAGDLDMDGDPDLILNGFWFPTPDTPAAARVAANYAHRVIDTAWFNQGGDWTADSCKVVVGDFDKDGANDVAFSQSERPGHEVSWYRSSMPNGAGPWTRHPVAVVDYCHNLQAADWDLDGDIDLLVGGMIQSQHRGLKLMLNGGSGATWSEFIIQSEGSYSAETGDIDNDGDLDIVGIRNWDSAPTFIYRNNAGGGPSLDFWAYHQVSASHVRTFGLCFPDLDGDGNLDVASGPFVYLNPGPPLTGTWTQTALPGGVHAFASLDVDGDTRADLIAQRDNSVANRIDLFWVEAADPSGTAWSMPISIGSVPRSEHPEGFQGYRVAQLVAGGRPEIAVSTMQGIHFFGVPAANPSDGNWPRTLVAANDSDENVGVADIDADGDLDLSFTSGSSKQVKWARNPGDETGTWTVLTIGSFPEADWPDRCEAADLNGDGRVDIIVTEENSGSAPDALACWWEQPTSGATTTDWKRHTIATQSTMNNLDVADMDKDGDADLVLAEHRGTKRLAAWENNGLGTFTEHRVGEGRESHLGGRLADLDGDGDLDLVSIAYDDFTKVHAWRNDSPSDGATGTVRISDAMDEGLACYKIETPTATYYYDKAGGGFTSLLDADGVDWITFHPQPGTGSAGEYRGIPNSGELHPGEPGGITGTTDPHDVPLPKVTITTLRAGWAAKWEFFPSYAKMTMTTVPAGGKYWLLYEGTPGGALDGADQMFLSNGREYSCHTSHPWKAGHSAPDDFEDISNTSGSAAGKEWVFFAASEMPRSLYLAHSDDAIEDDYWPMQDNMTVFGFGRNDASQPLLDQTNGALVIGFVESRDVTTVKRAIDAATDAPSVAIPVISPDGGVFDEPLAVTLTCATAGAELWFTTDGSDPTNQSPSALYTNAIPVMSALTLKARGFSPDHRPSPITSASFLGPKVKPPVLAPSGGTFSTTQTVTISCATKAATIRVTTNGLDPHESDPAYDGPLTLTSTTTVKARGFRAGLQPSDVVEGTFTRFQLGAVAHWRLDERFGAVAADSSGGSRNGTVIGPTWTAGHRDNALFFDGTDDRVECGAWDGPGSAVTFCAWIKLDPAFVDNDARILSKAVGIQEQDHWWMLSTTMSGGERRLRARLKAGGSTTTLIAASGNLPLNTWMHAAAAYDGTALRLFLNGVEVGSTPKSGALDANPAAALWIGANPPTAYAPFHGLIDDVRIYNSIMDANAVTAVMNEIRSKPTPRVIRIEPAPGQGWLLLAAGEIGHYLHLERSTNLLPTDWQIIDTQPLDAASATFNDPNQLPRAFYRLRME